MVRIPRARRTGMTVFMAGCSAGGVEEGEAMLAEGGGAFGGREADGDAEGFEDVGGAALRGDGAVAVFGVRWLRRQRRRGRRRWRC